MSTRKTDMFHSDLVFLRVASVVLMLLGGSILVFILSCRLLGIETSEWDLVPLFGGFDLYRRELAAINLPLAMLILGIGLRLRTAFGWGTCLVLLLMLLGSFALLSWRLSRELEGYWQTVAERPEVASQHPLLESITLNLSLAGLVVIFMVYLLLPQVRRLFWRPKPAPQRE